MDLPLASKRGSCLRLQPHPFYLLSEGVSPNLPLAPAPSHLHEACLRTTKHSAPPRPRGGLSPALWLVWDYEGKKSSILYREPLALCTCAASQGLPAFLP